MGAESVDRRLASLAVVQHGVVSRRQLVGEGLGRGAIEHRVEAGRLHRVHRGVYAIGHPRLSPAGHLLAAVLACGEGAVLSHRAAAAHWRIRPSAATRIDIAVPVPGGRRKRRGITVHRLASLEPRDVTVHDGIPVTTVARTLLDLAAVLPARAGERAVEEAERLRLFDLGEIHELLRRKAGLPGASALRSVLERVQPGTTLTRNDLEESFLALCDDNHLPRPEVNAWLDGYEVDFLWRAQRLAAETDGRATHGTRAAFERDRRRDVDLTMAGYRVVRFTHRQVLHERRAIAAALCALLRGPLPRDPSE